MLTEGYEVHERAIRAADCLRLGAALRKGAGGRAGRRHVLSHPAVGELARSVSMRDLAGAVVGPGAVPLRATLFAKSGRANWLVVWHQDTALPLAGRLEARDWGPWSRKDGIDYAHAPAWALERVVALRVHLDDNTPHNGPLRVIPGSHGLGVLSDEEILRVAAERPPVDILGARGSVLVMRPLLIHRSSKARIDAPRRVLHIEYAASLDLGGGVRLAVT